MARGHPEIHLARNGNLRLLYAVLGWLFVVLGVIGIFLPIMPTTPFLLLAAACFARGSESAYRMLINNRYCGPYIHQWRSTGSVPLKAKLTAILMIVVTLSISIAFFVPVVSAQIALGVIGFLVILYLLRLPTRPKA